MREILFKAKCIDGGNWIYGDLIHRLYGITISTNMIDRLHDLYVDENTICQYTGLTDKDGKKIWENDIVKTSRYGVDDGKGHNYAGIDTFYIVFSEGSYCLMNGWRRFNLRCGNDMEVIGNIFDNTNLLKGGVE